MKLTVALLLLAAVSQAAEEQSSSRSSAPSRSKQKTTQSNTEKRALVEGNAGVEKRTPAVPNALPSPTPGIEYADSKELHTDKSPQQQIYATPVPQLAKISDVLTGQGPPFQAAIASHLFSPVSIYTPRLASPTYEISAPVPSQLAYSEKITYRPQTPEQFTPQVFKKPNFPRPTYPQQIQYQQLPQQQQVLQYQPPQQLPQQIVQFQQPQILQQQPQVLPQQYQQLQPVYNPQPVQYQNPVQYTQQPIYIPQQLPAPAQPGIVYAQQEQVNQKPIQRELKTAETAQNNPPEKPEQNYNKAAQGAVSYASFSVGPATPSQQKYQPQPQTEAQYRPQPQLPQQQPQLQTQPEIQYRQSLQPQIQYQPQPQTQTEQYRPLPQQQIQYQPQIQQYQTQTPQIQQIQNQQYQIQKQPLPQFTPQYQNYQYQLQPQHQFQIQPQIIQKLEPSPVNSVAVPSKAVAVGSEKQISYYRPDPVVYQPQGYQHNYAFENQFATQALAVPTFPPVQFFGKFAQSIFKNYQQ
ncbi:transcription factor SPT20 homolog [Pectinophora gossypiella]|uniref:transcription factor SPT20 homolog n=1 Tax=Pectinophora gossypiella TaxID=13191 RepID=UPI00214E2922|nr:transcription factor SPT20 homolog [Pectinophora gossypiella]